MNILGTLNAKREQAWHRIKCTDESGLDHSRDASWRLWSSRSLWFLSDFHKITRNLEKGQKFWNMHVLYVHWSRGYSYWEYICFKKSMLCEISNETLFLECYMANWEVFCHLCLYCTIIMNRDLFFAKMHGAHILLNWFLFC